VPKIEVIDRQSSLLGGAVLLGERAGNEAGEDDGG
jgi:hypothetical protein